jgi:hypothetical protein
MQVKTTMKYLLTLVSMAINFKKQQKCQKIKSSGGKDIDKREHLHTVCRHAK